MIVKHSLKWSAFRKPASKLFKAAKLFETPTRHCSFFTFWTYWTYSYESFEVFTAVTMKNGVFWDVTPCDSCKNRRFEELSAFFIRVTRIGQLGTTLALTSNPDGGAKFLRNVGSYKSHTAQHPRRRHSSSSYKICALFVYPLPVSP
jgi:hypothetical protein